MCRWWTSSAFSSDSHFFFLFFTFCFVKEMRGLSRALHSWQASPFHTRRGSPAWTRRLLSAPLDSPLHRRKPPLCCEDGGRGGDLEEEEEEVGETFWIKPHWNNTERLGLSVPAGEPLQLNQSPRWATAGPRGWRIDARTQKQYYASLG